MSEKDKFDAALPGDKKSKYCGYGSCDNVPGHVGGHRCRCGKLVEVESPGCAWHLKPPKPMTTSILKAYLEFSADGFLLEDQPVMVQGREVVNAHILDGRVVLQTWPEHLEMMRLERES